MRYPCAHEGVRKIGIAAILTIAVTVIGMITNLIGILAAESLDNLDHMGGEIPHAAVVISILAVPMAILSLVGMVIKIIGVRKASQEEPEFDSAFWVIFIQIVLSVINGFISADCRGAKLGMNVASDIFGLLAAVFIIKGIMTLAGFLENNEVAGKAPAVRNVFIITYVVGIAIRIVSYMAYKSDSFYVTNGIAGVTGCIILIAAYLYYLKFLKEAESMLGYNY